MFFGAYFPRLDDKGRLFLPAKFREYLAEGLVITRGQDHCLYVWPRAEFLRSTEPFKDVPLSNARARAFLRMLAAGATDETPDKQGRIVIPAMLREYARLDRECAVIGAISRVEIWDIATWNAYQAEQETNYAELSEEVLPGLI